MNQASPIPQFGGGFMAVTFVAHHHGIQVTASQLAHQMAMGNAVPNADDLARAAKMAGLKARVVRKPDKKRLTNLPVPAVFRNHDGTWAVFGVETVPGKYRVTDPLSKQVEQLTLDEVLERLDRDIIIFSKSFDVATESLKFGLSWFVPAIKRYRHALTQVMVASFFINILGLAKPLVFQLVVDKVLVSKSYSTLVVVISAMTLLAVFETLLKYLRAYMLSHTSNRIDVELGATLFAHLVRLPMSFFERRAAGVIVTRAREIENIRRFMTDQALTSAIDLFFIFIYIGVLFLYSTTLTLVLLVLAPFYVLIGALARPAYRHKVKEKARRWARGQQLLVESVVGIQTLKAAAVEPVFQRHWEERLSSYVRTGFESTVLGAKMQNSVEFITRLTTAAILFFGAQEVIQGAMTVGALIAFNMLANRVTQPIMRTAQLYQSFQEVQVSIEHLSDILNSPMEKHSETVSAMPQQSRGAIELRDVSFRYRPELPEALRNISLDISPGEVIGIVGPSGSGKSTLTKLLQRFYSPTSGAILLDGIDIAQADPAWVRRQLGVVLQENFLFNQTVAENIALARPEMPRPQVLRCARLAGADEFISKLPQGYDTPIEERGANLSGGQRQRIAIARALATDPRFLIFDEATSALDYESERIIRLNMDKISNGRTVIIIAHRLAAVRHCHRIIGMIDGVITEIGTHEDLLAKRDGLYARLWALQSDQSKE